MAWIPGFLRGVAHRMLDVPSRGEVEGLIESLLANTATGPGDGWRLLGGDARQTEPDQPSMLETRRKITVSAVSSPLLKQALRIKRTFAIGGEITVAVDQSEINAVISRWWNDELERMPEQVEEWFMSLLLYNELCIRVFERPDGMIQTRLIPLQEVTDVITDPNDRHVIRYVRSEYIRREFDTRSKFYAESAVDELIPGDEIIWISAGAIPGAVRAVSDIYAALTYDAMYQTWLKRRGVVNEASAAWAWLRKIKGGVTAVTEATKKLASDLAGKVRAATAGANNGYQPPPKAGSVLTVSEGEDWQIINAKVGASDAAEDGKAFRLQVAAALNIPEHYFGDASEGNRATTENMELPVAREAQDWQKLLTRLIRRVVRRLLQAQIRAGRLSDEYTVTVERLVDGEIEEREETRQTLDIHIDVNMPPLKVEDRGKRVEAAEREQRMGIKSNRTVYEELGGDNWESEQARLYRERLAKEERERQRRTAEYPPFEGDDEDDDDGGDE